MADLRLRFPGGKRRALTFSYDDGLPSDVRLVGIFDKYGMKGTFNLNSNTYRPEDDEPSENIKIERANMWTRAKKSEMQALFSDGTHEIAVHGISHTPFGNLPLYEAVGRIMCDRVAHERDYGRIVRGAAYPNGSVSDTAVEALAASGIAYCRTTTATRRFDIPKDWLRLDPTCHHNDPQIFELAKSFIESDGKDPMLFYVWGHSSEFVIDGNWERIERFCELLATASDLIWYATNIEIYDYVKAFEALIRSADGTLVFNPTSTDIFASVGGKRDVFIPAGSTVAV